jgi:hypothetical protein
VKHTVFLVLLMSLGMSGCYSTSYVRDTLSRAELGLPVKSVRASGVWSTGEPGHGLQVQVRSESDASLYARTLTLELDGAARVCAALAGSDRVLQWAYIDVYYFNTYQNLANASHQVAGVAEVIMRRETLLMLRDRHSPASEYPQHWRFVQGHKDQPDSREPLSW